MKKIKLLSFAILCNLLAIAGAGVELVITNNSKQKVFPNRITGDWQTGFLVGDIPLNIRNEIPVGAKLVITTRCNWGCGTDGTIQYLSQDGKGSFVINYTNPSIGSSEYSAHVTEGNYNVVIKSINDNVNPQKVEIEITGGDETPPKPRYKLITTGNNTISGFIEWNETINGAPINNDWASIFGVKCTVPTVFQVADFGNVTYNGEKGYYMGSIQTGTILFGALESLPNNVKRLAFSIVNVADNMLINNFDVTVKDGQVFNPPANMPKPGPTYKFYAGTVVVSAPKFVSPNYCTLSFGLISGWNDPTNGANNNNDFSNALTQKKRNSVLPASSFLRISNIKASTISNNSIRQNNNIKTNAIKNNIRIRQ